MGLLKIYNGGNYAHAQISRIYNFCWSSNSTKLIRLFIRHSLKSNNMGLLKIHNGGNNVHAKDKILTVITSTKLIRTFNSQFFMGNNMGLLKIHNGGDYVHAQDSN